MIAKDYGKSGFVCDYAGQENKANLTAEARSQETEDRRKK